MLKVAAVCTDSCASGRRRESCYGRRVAGDAPHLIVHGIYHLGQGYLAATATVSWNMMRYDTTDYINVRPKADE